MSKREISYEIGDHFMCLEFSMGDRNTYGFIGKVYQIKKRFNDGHHYYYKTIAKWGGNNYYISDDGMLKPGMLNFLCSQKITEEEVYLIKLIMA